MVLPGGIKIIRLFTFLNVSGAGTAIERLRQCYPRRFLWYRQDYDTSMDMDEYGTSKECAVVDYLKDEFGEFENIGVKFPTSSRTLSAKQLLLRRSRHKLKLGS